MDFEFINEFTYRIHVYDHFSSDHDTDTNNEVIAEFSGVFDKEQSKGIYIYLRNYKSEVEKDNSPEAYHRIIKNNIKIVYDSYKKILWENKEIEVL